MWEHERLATVTVGGRGYEIQVTADGAPIEWNANTAIAFTLLPMMHAGRPVSWPGLSPRLAATLPAIQSIYRAFVPELAGIPVATPDTIVPRSDDRVGMFLSGGIDSLHVLATRMSEVTDVVLVHGFDITWTEDATFVAVRAHATDIARRFGKRLTVVRTNLRDMSDAYSSWEMYHGGALAGVALMLGFRRMYIGSSYRFEQLHAWGSHPLLDPLWSTEATEIVHWGADVSRVDKLREIARLHPALLERLRVCWQHSAEYNCGTCEKCLRTVANLAVAGASDWCRTLPRDLPPERIGRFALTSGAAYFWREMVDAPALAQPVRRAIAQALRNQRHGLTPADGTLKSRVKRLRDQLLLARDVFR